MHFWSGHEYLSQTLFRFKLYVGSGSVTMSDWIHVLVLQTWAHLGSDCIFNMLVLDMVGADQKQKLYWCYYVRRLILSEDPALAMAFSTARRAAAVPLLLVNGTYRSTVRAYLDSSILEHQLHRLSDHGSLKGTLICVLMMSPYGRFTIVLQGIMMAASVWSLYMLELGTIIPSTMQEHNHIQGLHWKFQSFGLYIANQFWWINIIRQRLCLIWSLLFSRIHHLGKAIFSVMDNRLCGTWGNFMLLVKVFMSKRWVTVDWACSFLQETHKGCLSCYCWTPSWLASSSLGLQSSTWNCNGSM